MNTNSHESSTALAIDRLRRSMGHLWDCDAFLLIFEICVIRGKNVAGKFVAVEHRNQHARRRRSPDSCSFVPAAPAVTLRTPVTAAFFLQRWALSVERFPS